MRLRHLQTTLLVGLTLFASLAITASGQINENLDMSDPVGNTILGSDFSAVSELPDAARGPVEPSSYPPSNLSTEDYQDIYAQAMSLLHSGIEFRLCKLQLQTEQGKIDCPVDPNDPSDYPILDQYYRDFNSGELLDAYCPEFNINNQGFCGEDNNVRNALLQARRLFASLYLVRNEAMTFTIDPDAPEVSIRATGLEGMLNATRELAYAHMIFGSEYAIDAFDYAFTMEGLSGDAICSDALTRYQGNLGKSFDSNVFYFTDQYFTDAECIIKHESALLAKSLEQYVMALDVMTSAYHEDIAWPKAVIIGELFTQAEVQIFAVAVENYAAIVDEMAMRQRQLGDDTTAIALYAETYDRLYLLTLPLMERIRELYQSMDDEDIQTLLSSNGLAVRSGLDLMKSRRREIDNEINVFGFTPDYVPVQSYTHMRDSSQDLFSWAEQAFGGDSGALATTRQFELNRDALNAEMRSIRDTYQNELVNLCGPVDKNENFDVCNGSEGSLMEQSWLNLASASLAMNLANRRIESALQRMVDVQAQTAQVIQVRSETGETMAAKTLAQGMARAFQVTSTTSNSIATEAFQEESVTLQKVTNPGLFTNIPENLDDVVVGVPVEDGVPDGTVTKIAGQGQTIGAIVGSIIPGVGTQAGAMVGRKVAELFNDMFGSTERTLIQTQTKGVRHSQTSLTSVNTVFNPSEIRIAELENVKQMALLAQDIEILNIQTRFEIRDIFRSIAELQIEKEQAANSYNRAVSEHNRLVNRWFYLKAQYKRAQEDLNANYLANPAYRLLKDSATEKATYNLLFAAKQAYLTAKALEYHMGVEIPFIDQVFTVRHPAHLQAYHHLLEELNKIKDYEAESNIEFSLRVIASGIRDQDISTAPAEERQTLIALRQERFLAFLEKHLITDESGNPEMLVLVFDTSLENRPINTPSRYNWRIAGAQTGSTDPSVDRCPVRKPYGVSVEIQQGPQTLPNGMTVELTMTGHTSTRTRNGIVHYSPQLVTLLPPEYIPSSVYERLTEAVADATLDVNDPENTISDFCNMSVAASAWILEIPLAENQIDYRQFQDIKLKMWTFYYS